MARFADRLSGLGYSSYTEYLLSDHWRQFKESYRAAGLPMRCAVCGAGRVQLHHHTYRRLGCEQHSDITPLCRSHHVAVHDWLKTSGRVFVHFTAEAVAALAGTAPPKKRRGLSGKALGLKTRDQKRAKRKGKKGVGSPPSNRPLTKKQMARNAARDARAARLEPEFAPYRTVLTTLLEEGRLKPRQFESTCNMLSATVAQRVIAKAKRRPIGVFTHSPPVQNKVKTHHFEITPRATPAFQLNAKAVPGRDMAEQKSRVREILAARKKGVG